MSHGNNTADAVVSDIRLVAVIDIGATRNRMTVAAVRGEGTNSEIRTLDSLVQRQQDLLLNSHNKRSVYFRKTPKRSVRTSNERYPWCLFGF